MRTTATEIVTTVGRAETSPHAVIFSTARWVRVGKRSCSLAMAAALSALTLLLGPFDQVSSSTNRVAVACALITLSVAGAVRLLLSRVRSPSERKFLIESDRDQVKLSQHALSQFNDKFSAEEISKFIELALDPSEYILRISEQLTLGDELYRFKMVQTITGTKAPGVRRLLVPILYPPKGDLVAQLKISCGSTPVRTLTYFETVGAMLTMGLVLMRRCFNSVPLDLWRNFRDQVLLERVARKGEGATLAALLSDYGDKVARNPDDKDDPAPAQLFRCLRNVLFDSQGVFPIVAVVPVSQEVKLVVEYVEGRARVEGAGPGNSLVFWEWIYSYIRSAFGLVRRSHIVRLSRAPRTQSYHLRTEAPEGLYVYDVRRGLTEALESDDSRTASFNSSHRANDPRWHVADTRGLTHVHAYGRDLDVSTTASPGEAGDPDSDSELQDRATLPRPMIPFLTIELREKPPGLMFVVTLLAVYLMILTWGGAHWHELIFGVQDVPPCEPAADPCPPLPKPATFWPTVLFGVPAIISGWLVSRFTIDSVSRISVSTLAIAAWFITNSVFAMLAAALKLSGVSYGHVALPGIGVFDPLWSTLLVSTTSCAYMAMFLFALRIRRYRRRVSGEVDP